MDATSHPTDNAARGLVSDMYARYATLRSESPVHGDGSGDHWNVYRYVDVQRVLADHTAFSSDMSAGSPPEHRVTRLLALATPSSSICLSRG